MEYRKIRHFRDLIVWQKAHEVTLLIYRITNSFPRRENYSLTDQMRRASVSVGSNIAEGFSRLSTPDKVHFFVMAKGSLTELENQLYIAKDVGYLQATIFDDLEEKITVVGRLLTAIMKSTSGMEKNAIL